MSQPFAQLVSKRAALRTDAELTDEAFARLNRWSMLSTDKHVSLEEVAWLAAFMMKALKAAGINPMAKSETVDENGSRVVGIVASDGVRVADGAA